jgi:hypothetical protein
MVREDREVTRTIVGAHHQAMGEVAHQLAVAAVAEAPVLVGHELDSQGQPWLHTHVIYGALARAGKADPGGWLVVDGGGMERLAQTLIWGYHLLVRHQLTDLLAELELNWSLPAADGSCEVLGLSAGELATIAEPARPLGEISACRDDD